MTDTKRAAMRAASVCLLLFPLAGGCAPAARPDLPGAPALPRLDPQVGSYLQAAIDTLRRVTHHTDVNWAMLQDSMTMLAEGATEPRDVYPVIDWLLQKVDKHSFLQTNMFGVRDAAIAGSIGYLRIPFWSNTTTVQGTTMYVPTLADTLQSMIKRRDASGACQWIIDLRSNGGGNMWPMLAGIGPLLGDSLVGGNVSPRGRSYWKYARGVAALVHEDGREEALTTATAPVNALRSSNPPVAVLIDNGTGSSGEVMAVAFKQRPLTRFFGTPTAGATTTNQGFRLPNGVNMVITVGTYVDRAGNTYGRPVDPDVQVQSPMRAPSILIGDPVVRAAVDWLRTQPCSAGAD